MRHVLIALIAGLLAVATVSAQAADTGRDGAKSGCYKDGKGRVKMSAKGKTTGDVDVTIEDGNGESDTGLGTQAGDGGVWESEEMSVGGQTYQVRAGKLCRQKPNGGWQGMDKVDDKQCEEGGGHGPGAPNRGGDGTVGTLPDWPLEMGYVYVPGWDEQLNRPKDPLRDMIPA